MYKFRLIIVFAGLLALGLLTGCATSRSELKLAAPPTAVVPTTAVTKGVFYLRSVTDERIFEEKPSDPSHPSLGFGGAAAATADVKARAIGRKRNTFGQGLGDVLLENGQTVIGVVRDNLTAAFQAAGYRVVTVDPGADAKALTADVHVKTLWAWFQPGFWAIKLNTNVATELSFDGGRPPLTIDTHAEDSRRMATDSAWMAIIDKALADYRVKATAAATALH